MSKKESYTIPFVGLKKEKHFFQFQLDEEFFKKDECSLIQKGRVTVDVIFDKSILPHILDFEIHGVIHTECDRCISEIDLPIEGENRVYVKYETDEQAEEDKPLEILYLHPKDQVIDLEIYLYDFVILSIPYTKECKDVQQECDPEVTKFLISETDQQEDSRWEDLKKIKFINK